MAGGLGPSLEFWNFQVRPLRPWPVRCLGRGWAPDPQTLLKRYLELVFTLPGYPNNNWTRINKSKTREYFIPV